MSQNDISNGTTYQQPILGSTSSLFYDFNVSVQALIDSNREKSVVKIYRYPLDTPKYYLSMDISKYLPRLSPLNIQTQSTNEIIILSLPLEISDNHKIDYETKELGTGFGGAVNAGYGVKNYLENYKAKPPVMPDSAAPPMTKFPNGLPRPGSNPQTLIPPQAPNTKSNGVNEAIVESAAAMGISPVAALAGVAPNKFQVVLLKGPTFKRHTYTWSFYPQSIEESENIRLICQLLKNSMSPGMAFGELLFTFPRVFQLTFRPNAQYLYKHKPAVLEKFNVDYAASGIPSFFRSADGSDSAPTAIKMTMTFLELEFWLNGDFKDNNVSTGHIERGLEEKPDTPMKPGGIQGDVGPAGDAGGNG